MNDKKNAEKALSLLLNSKTSGYKIEKATGITQASISNYRNGKTEPEGVMAYALIKYFEDEEKKECKFEKIENIGDCNLEFFRPREVNFEISKEYMFAMLNERFEYLKELTKQKEALFNQLLEKDKQMAKKDEQIGDFLDIINKLIGGDAQHGKGKKCCE